MIKAVRDEMYDYPVLTPEDYNNYETRLYLGQGSCHWHYTFPASRWAKTEAPLLEKIPKLEGFVDSPPYGRVSIGKAPAGEILDAIEAQALEKKIYLVDDDYAARKRGPHECGKHETHILQSRGVSMSLLAGVDIIFSEYGACGAIFASWRLRQ